MKKKRNWGIDLLRIISMIMIVTLHTLSHGGLLDNSPKMALKYELIWFIEILAYCSVNIFAIISGFVGVNNRFKYSNIINLWILAAFYTVINSIIGTYLFPDTYHTTDVLSSLFPISTERYWYFTSYFCMSFFVPTFNYLLNTLPRKEMFTVIISSIFLFSGMTTFNHSDLFLINFGYSPLWLSILYLIGGYIKRYDYLASWSKSKLFTIYLGTNIFTFISKFLIDWFVMHNDIEFSSWYFIRYTSPTMLISAVALVILFAKIRPIKSIPIIKFFTPLCFSVYLIHVHPVWFQLIDHRLEYLLDFHPIILIFQTGLWVLIIFLVCAFIDYLRLKLFGFLKVKSFSDKLAMKLGILYNHFISNFD